MPNRNKDGRKETNAEVCRLPSVRLVDMVLAGIGDFPPAWSGNRLCCDTGDEEPHEDDCAWVHGKWAIDELARRAVP